jgi:hypothetical protein
MSTDLAPLPKEIVLLQQTAAYLDQCQSLDEVKNIRDQAEAIRLYQKKVGLSQRAMNSAAEIKIRAERRMGELLAAMPKQRPGQYQRSHAESLAPKLADLGISHNESSRVQAIAAVPAKKFEATIREAKESNHELTSREMIDLGRRAQHRTAATSRKPHDETSPLPIADLTAPFPYFGGKRRAAGIVWAALGDVDNYIEPFGGSAAVLLARPHPPQFETLNDVDCYIANFWRATQWAPEEVVQWADWPVNQTDLYARHRWLTCSEEAKRFRSRMREDPSYYDPRIAGWWCWGQCLWIGSGWCRVPADESGITDKRPQVHGMGVHGNDSAETCQERRESLLDRFNRLRDRLRTVRVCCCDWRRVCSSESVTTQLGTVGLFFDPTYSGESGRTPGLYGVDSLTVAHEAREYCLERGGDPRYRIVLAGLAGEGHEVLEESGWSVVAWESHGGYNRTEAGKDRARRERLWLSPHCLPVPSST